MEKFRCESRAANYILPDTSVPHSAEIDGFKIGEDWSPHDHATRRPGLKTYRVIIEGDVDGRSELYDTWGRACDLIAELDHAWPYGIGEPLHPVFTAIKLGDGPAGWTSTLSLGFAQRDAVDVAARLAQVILYVGINASDLNRDNRRCGFTVRAGLNGVFGTRSQGHTSAKFGFQRRRCASDYPASGGQ